ncbi:NAD(P)H dehydrogenase (quinone) [Tenacibaculum sp. 190524A02b]|uniref:NAD(P)H dehydrogenase (Quinone) n=1 Tax=Tenacibaculum vairaonense TaxID=3137860 RepID=A0ABP1F7L1_9FLAO
MKELSKPTIVVFGATGTVGSEVVKILSKRNCHVRGILRSPERILPKELKELEGVSYVAADLKNKEHIKQVCSKADAIFLLTATSLDQITYETNIIEVAKVLNIERIVKLSAPVVPNNIHVEVSDWHRKIERELKESKLDYCVLQPHSFMQNWERNTFTIKHFGKIYGVMGEAVRNYVDARDVAEIAVKYLLKSTKLNEEALVISGPEALSHQNIAERLSYVTGKKVSYEDISRDAFLHKLTKQAKLPKWLAYHIVELDVLAQKWSEPTTDTVEVILDRKPRIIDAYLQEKRELFLPSRWRSLTS